MTGETDSFAGRSREIAARFLQTVVIVDDEAIFRDSPPEVHATPADSDTPSRQTEPEGARESVPSVDPDAASAGLANESRPKLIAPSDTDARAVREGELDSHELDAKTVIDGFAEHGLVCAVLKPGSGDEVRVDSRSAMARADIVVLDWVLHNDYGDKALKVIGEILKADVQRLRLIAIYTGQGNLASVAERVTQLLSDQYVGHEVHRPNAFTVQKGPARVAVFAKPKARVASLDAEAVARVANSEALPTLLIDEFAQMTSGLVTNVAVASLSALRDNTHRILHKLRPRLDAGYLWHRATQVYPEEAEDHLTSMIADEILGLLEDEKVSAYANLDAVQAWLATFVPSDNYKERFNLPTAVSREDVVDLLRKGAGGKGKESVLEKFPTLGRKAHTQAHQCFAETIAANTAANEEFAMLLSLRSHYGSTVPVLTLGTVLKSGEDLSPAYWLCIQPACDSVRLAERTAFPLLPLATAQPGQDFHLVVRSDAQSIRLRLLSKPSLLRMEEFDVTSPARGVVEASSVDNLWVFTASAGQKYCWLADLKPQHALWMGNELVTQLNRVGLIESEWMRRWNPR